jgi:hypothetical protein
MRVDFRASAEAHRGTDDRIGADRDAFGQIRAVSMIAVE